MVDIIKESFFDYFHLVNHVKLYLVSFAYFYSMQTFLKHWQRKPSCLVLENSFQTSMCTREAPSNKRLAINALPYVSN